MNIFPPLKARVSALERQQIVQNARIEEVAENMTNDIKQLSDDMKARFKQLAVYQVEMEQSIEARFNQVDEHLGQVDARLDKIETRLDRYSTRFDQIEICLDKIETRFDNVESLVIQVLERLPEKPHGNS